MKKMKKNRSSLRAVNTLRVFGILAAVLSVLLAGCFNPADLPTAAEEKAPGISYEPYTVSVSLVGDETDISVPAARSVAGPTRERIVGLNIRNIVQIIAVDKATGEIRAFCENRRTGVSQTAPSLVLRNLVVGHSYAVLYLQGHWERNYGAEWQGNYAYTNDPPTLLAVGYSTIDFKIGATLQISVWPLYVNTTFTTAGGSTAEPPVANGKPGVTSLAPAAWNVNWSVVRGSSGTSDGFGDLVEAQKVVNSQWTSLIAQSLKAVVRADGYTETAPTPTLSGFTITLPLNGNYTGLSSMGKGGSANFALSIAPFNLTTGWARHNADSVFDLTSGPPVWIIRNGLNGLAQNDYTDFTNFGNMPIGAANGNGAVRFAVATPQVNSGLVVSNGSYKDKALTFTASGFTGTAQAWYAAVGIQDPPAPAPAYAAYTPLGDVVAGANAKEVALSGFTQGCDVYVVLLKDGWMSAPQKISLSASLLVEVTYPDGDPK
jgi:hypothetical protein